MDNVAELQEMLCLAKILWTMTRFFLEFARKLLIQSLRHQIWLKNTQ